MTVAIAIRADNSTLSSFIIGGWGDEGIEVDGSTGFGNNNIIENIWVGINSSDAAAGVGDDGILITENANGDTIRNNVIGSSGGDGIDIRTNSDNNWVWCNTIGLANDYTVSFTLDAVNPFNFMIGLGLVDGGTPTQSTTAIPLLNHCEHHRTLLMTYSRTPLWMEAANHRPLKSPLRSRAATTTNTT